MKILIGSSSIVGGRDNNEDAVGWLHREGKYLLAVVADGLGGHPGGAEAAQVAVAAARKVEYRTADVAMNFICAAVEDIPERFRRFSQQTHMTTCVFALWREGWDYVEVAWSGDSRLYARSPDGTVRQVTKDHSNGCFLLACLGDGQPRQYELCRLPVSLGTRLLLCSDGVSGPFDGHGHNTGRLHELLACTDKGLSEIAATLTAEAVSLSGKRADNATALLVDFLA